MAIATTIQLMDRSVEKEVKILKQAQKRGEAGHAQLWVL